MLPSFIPPPTTTTTATLNRPPNTAAAVSRGFYFICSTLPWYRTPLKWGKFFIKDEQIRDATEEAMRNVTSLRPWQFNFETGCSVADGRMQGYAPISREMFFMVQEVQPYIHQWFETMRSGKMIGSLSDVLSMYFDGAMLGPLVCIGAWAITRCVERWLVM